MTRIRSNSARTTYHCYLESVASCIGMAAWNESSHCHFGVQSRVARYTYPLDRDVYHTQPALARRYRWWRGYLSRHAAAQSFIRYHSACSCLLRQSVQYSVIVGIWRQARSVCALASAVTASHNARMVQFAGICVFLCTYIFDYVCWSRSATLEKE